MKECDLTDRAGPSVARDHALQEQIAQVVQSAYPEPWETAWLELPLPVRHCGQRLGFKVMCSDLPAVHNSAEYWPPASHTMDSWAHWEPSQGHGFQFRAKRRDPILRDRLILLERVENNERPKATITEKGVEDACLFVVQSARVVWHNPPKGGANSPGSAHFQSIPLRSKMTASSDLTLPCCGLACKPPSGGNCDVRLISLEEYPVLGATVSGPWRRVAQIAWEVIRAYDEAQACNLIIHPLSSHPEDHVRAFVFPRSRENHCRVTAGLLLEGEEILLHNTRGGVYSEWSFAGIEMGLLTQVEWGPIFRAMACEPEKWGASLHRILRILTLDPSGDDWADFKCVILPYIKPEV